MITQIRSFLTNESGATAVEYGLIAALVSVAGMTTMQQVGENMVSMFNVASTALDNANG